MSKISKRLLSWLCVIAMVLSFVPVVNLPAKAVENDAAEQSTEEEIVYGSANLTAEQAAEVQRGKDVQTAANAIVIPTEGTTFEAECPVCEKTVTWTKSTGAIGTKKDADTSYHYYWTGTIGGTGYNWISTNGGNKTKVCLLMRDAVSDGGNTFMVAGTDCEVNIMGTGTITSDGTKSEGYGLFKVSGTRCKLNLYGGTYVYTGNNVKDSVVTYGALNLTASATAVANIYGDTVIGKASVDTTAANYNVLVSKGTVNMYGGTIQNGVTGVGTRSGNVTVFSADGKFNLMGGTIKDGDYTGTPAYAGSNVRIDDAGYFDMYGGTISGGRTRNGGAGGSVYVQAGSANKAKCIANLMGGTITGGQSYSGGGNIGGWRGIINIGGTILISEGKVRDTSSHMGGNIYLPAAPITVNITGGKLVGSTAGYGGNIGMADDAKSQAELNISGGIITGGTANTNGGNICIGKYGKLNISGGTIELGETAGSGGNICTGDYATVTMTGGTISSGKATKNGGNIYLGSGATMTVGDDAVIENGTSYNAANGGGGGNIYLASSSTLTTSGTITGGTVDGGEDMQSAGGNINVVASGANYATLIVNGGVISNGKLAYSTKGSCWGANIRSYNSKVVINDGLIYGTESSTIKSSINVAVLGGGSDTADSYSYFEMNGGIIVGDVSTGTVATGTKTTNKTDSTVQHTYTCEYKFTGSPKILKSYTLEDGTTATARQYGLTIGVPVDISGLNQDAEIVLSNSLGKVLTIADANAANVESCFTTDSNDTIVQKQEDNTLKVVEKPANAPEVGVFAPWDCENLAYCPVCYENGTNKEPVEWIAITSATAAFTMATESHYYLAEDITNASVNGKSAYIQGCGSKKICCLNLNGKELTVTDGRALFGGTGTFNIMDTDGKAVVSGANNVAGNAATLLLNSSKAGATVNIYGGTFKKAASATKASIVCISSNGGTINMYGGCIDGTGLTTNDYATGVYLVGGIYNEETNVHGGLATFNMFGGEIKNGATGNAGGNVFVGDSGSIASRLGAAFFNMSGDAQIYGGQSMVDGKNAGNVLVQSEGTFTMTGNAKVYNGQAANQGGNIRVYNATMTMSGNASVYGGTAKASDNIWLVDAKLVMSGDAVVSSTDTNNGDAVNAASYRKGSTVILSGNATIKRTSGASQNSLSINYYSGEGDEPSCNLQIANDWTGEAYLTTTKDGKNGYGRGETMDNATAGFCGALADGTVTKGGSFSGKLYYGPGDNAGVFGVDGNLVIGTASIDTKDGKVWYISNQAAVDAYTGEGYVWLRSNQPVELAAGKEYTMNCSGYNITVTGSGTLKPFDHTNDDYVGSAKWTVADTVEVVHDVTNPVNGYRYIVLKEADGTYTAHRIEMILTHVTLRTTEAGLYYKAQFKCDNALAARVLGYGTVLSQNNMPGNDFMTEAADINEWTLCDPATFVPGETHEINTTSAGLFGILKAVGENGRTKEENVTAAQMKIYANLYLAVDLTGNGNLNTAEYFLGDIDNQNTENGTSFTMLQVLEAINETENWNNYSDAQKENVKTALETWAGWVTDEAAAQWAGKFSNILA